MTILATIDEVRTGQEMALVAAVIGLMGILILLWRRRLLQGTTLMAPWYWSVLSLFVVAGSEVLITWPGDGLPAGWHEPVRFAAGATVFCPCMAALGAKRPQDKAWQLIVLSLWAILVLPAFENMLLQPGQPMEIKDARSWFLVSLIVVGAVNTLPTRFWPSALLLTAAQTLLFAPYLPVVNTPLAAPSRLAGLLLCVIAIGLVAVGLPPRRAVKLPVDRLWLDFRDGYGTFWALRLAERINAAGSMYHWNITLTWRGFRTTDVTDVADELTPQVAEGIHRTINNLLRRFVSPQWISRRLDANAAIVEPRGYESAPSLK